ncbi:MAG: hypothetical protein AAGM33_11705 [Pseudomonadota bacterium]
MTDLAAIARAEYDKRFTNCLTMHRADQFTQQIADRLHNWERIAWLYDPAGRDSDNRPVIGERELAGMAAEAGQALQAALKKHDADMQDRKLRARAKDLLDLSSDLKARAAGLAAANKKARASANAAQQRKAA